jgi:hypothetical protein
LTPKDWLREPLVHFLGIGALVFVLYGLVSGRSPPTASDRIEVTRGQIQRLEDAWAQQWRRPPTPAELQRLIDDHIRQEVLYREALALGLDADDMIIRRRLAQKMEFLAEDLVTQLEPSDEVLQAYFRVNTELFRVPARTSFTHIYFSIDSRGSNATEDAELALLELHDSSAERAPERGDRFMLEYDYASLSEEQVARLFGTGFAEKLFELPPGQWAGPVESGYGIHVVRVSDRLESRLPPFEDVRDRVRIEYFNDLRQQTNEEVYELLRDRYEILVEERQP